jgi:glycosyltransferase A (GT-A) superfamily protein (DUF2064 family)
MQGSIKSRNDGMTESRKDGMTESFNDGMTESCNDCMYINFDCMNVSTEYMVTCIKCLYALIVGMNVFVAVFKHGRHINTQYLYVYKQYM